MTTTAPAPGRTAPTGVELNASVADYAEQGYVVVPDAFSRDEIDEVCADAVRVFRGEYGEVDGVTPPLPGETDDELVRRYLCLHHPHKFSEVMQRALRQPRVVDVLTQVIGPNVKAMQSMLFVKAEGKPGQAWHQDEFFIPTRDRSLTGVWIALDDATIENGCLWVLPGSHRDGVIYPDREHDDERFDCNIELYQFPYADDDAVPVELKAGTALVFNGYLLHRSLPNSGRHGLRRALVNHYMSANSLLPWLWSTETDHVGKADHRDIEMIAGVDPYAWKGTQDLLHPGVRPEKEGGCDR